MGTVLSFLNLSVQSVPEISEIFRDAGQAHFAGAAPIAASGGRRLHQRIQGLTTQE